MANIYAVYCAVKLVLLRKGKVMCDIFKETVLRQRSENYTIFKTAARVPHHTPVICYVLFHDATDCRLYFGIDCQTTLQVQEKLISRSPVEIYVQLGCYCCVRILGQLSGYWAT